MSDPSERFLRFLLDPPADSGDRSVGVRRRHDDRNTFSVNHLSSLR